MTVKDLGRQESLQWCRNIRGLYFLRQSEVLEGTIVLRLMTRADEID